MIRGHFLRTVSYLPHVKEHTIKGHLSYRDTLLDIGVSLEGKVSLYNQLSLCTVIREMLYLAVLKISQFGEDLIWRY